ncbi:GNAT family N-acetyltransferase [Agaribacterium haliotis]|uniref:GNAT family N-acetyltransferase n=1 Tax=Agaribacterium haliotis TaxID=2013869 RepID=UPI0013042030|nr:GNAT family N-acetyltransferase [Agaribacterium haliotis]
MSSASCIDVSLRICNLADHKEHLPTLAFWHHEEWLNGRPYVPERDKYYGFKRRLQVLRSHFVEQALPRSFVALYNGEPVASVSLVYFVFTERQKKSLWLTNLYVPPQLRRQGLGELMLDYALDYALSNEKEQEKLLLYTRDKEIFYKKRGWQAQGSGRVQGQNVCILSYPLASSL